MAAIRHEARGAVREPDGGTPGRSQGMFKREEEQPVTLWTSQFHNVLLWTGFVYNRRTCYCVDAMVDNSVLTVKEVAALLRVDEKTVYRLVKKRELPGFKVAGAWRFKSDDIESWIEKQKAAET